MPCLFSVDIWSSLLISVMFLHKPVLVPVLLFRHFRNTHCFPAKLKLLQTIHTWCRFSFSALRSCISSSMFCIIVSISLHFCFSALHRCSDCSSCFTSSKNTHSLNTLTNCTKHFRSDQCSLTRKLLGASIWLKFKISQMYTFHSNNLFLFWRISLLKNLDKWGCLIWKKWDFCIWISDVNELNLKTKAFL